MKGPLYFTLLTSIVFSFSCTSVQKLVDQGRYDDAIYLAAEKLAGQNNPKTKYVKALEEAFYKVNIRDLEEISYFKAKNDPALWDRIYDMAVKIERRQNRISPFLPLVSKDGYLSQFQFADTRSLKLEAGQNAAAYHYAKGYALLEKAESGDRLSAKEAYYQLEKIEKYYNNYRDIDDLMDQAHDLGTTHILVQLDRSFNDILGMSPMETDYYEGTFKDKFWVNYHEKPDELMEYDFITTLYIDAMDVSPEREEINRYVETKTTERWIDLLNRNGEPVKDSSGNIIQVKNIETLEARVTEIVRTKSALVAGRAETRDFRTERLIDNEPMEVVINFRSEAFDVAGDRAALSDRVRKHIDHYLEPFPSDWTMAYDAGRKLLIAYQDFLDQVNY